MVERAIDTLIGRHSWLIDRVFVAVFCLGVGWYACYVFYGVQAMQGRALYWQERRLHHIHRVCPVPGPVTQVPLTPPQK